MTGSFLELQVLTLSKLSALLAASHALLLLFYTLCVLAACCIFLACINRYTDIYGLFSNVRGKKLPVYYKEKISKFLLAEKYIPANYNTVVLGTSLSDNLDVTAINQRNQKFRIYNASIMGIDISALNALTIKLVNGGINNVVICVSPYLIKKATDSLPDLKTPSTYIFPGTRVLYQSYFIGLIRYFRLLPSRFPRYQYTYDGVHNYYFSFTVTDIEKKITEVIEDNLSKPIVKDPSEILQFGLLVNFLKEKGVNFLMYYHPLPNRIYDSKREEYEMFYQQISLLVDAPDRVIDFNRPEFLSFTSDYTNYLDHGHLSQKGQSLLGKHLEKKLTDLKLSGATIMKVA